MAYAEISLIDEGKVTKENTQFLNEINQNTQRIIREFKGISKSYDALFVRIEALESEQKTLKERLTALEARN